LARRSPPPTLAHNCSNTPSSRVQGWGAAFTSPSPRVRTTSPHSHHVRRRTGGENDLRLSLSLLMGARRREQERLARIHRPSTGRRQKAARGTYRACILPCARYRQLVLVNVSAGGPAYPPTPLCRQELFVDGNPVEHILGEYAPLALASRTQLPSAHTLFPISPANVAWSKCGRGRGCAEFYLEGDKRDRLQKTTYCMCALTSPPLLLRPSPLISRRICHICSRRGGTPDALRGIPGGRLAPQGTAPHLFHRRSGTISQVLFLSRSCRRNSS
jgi:hypothetical protein